MSPPRAWGRFPYSTTSTVMWCGGRKKENLGLDIGKHPAYNGTFAGARFTPHFGAGFQSLAKRTVR